MKIEILSTEQNADGTWNIVFDYDEEYLDSIKMELGKKDLSEEEISSFILSKIEEMISKK